MLFLRRAKNYWHPLGGSLTQLTSHPIAEGLIAVNAYGIANQTINADLIVQEKGTAYGFNNATSQYISSSINPVSLTNGATHFLWYKALTGSVNNFQRGVSLRGSSHLRSGVQIYNSNSIAQVFACFDFEDNNNYLSANIPIVDDNYHVLMAGWGGNGNTAKIYYDSKIIGDSSLNGTGTPFGTASDQDVGRLLYQGTYYYGDYKGIVLSASWARLLTDAEFMQVSENPWDLFAKQKYYFSLGGGNIVLTADSAAVATATGALSTQIPIAASALIVAAATGALSLPAAELSSSASITVTAGGAITVSINLAGQSINNVLAQAGLTSDILLSATAGGQVGATGDLSTGTGFSGAASMVATVTGSFTTAINLSAQAIIEALANADLTSLPSGLSGTAQAVASASGALLTAIPLSGNPVVTVTGQGDLNTQIPLSGSAVDVVLSQGQLMASILFDGNIAALALAGATLSTQINLNAQALIQALATADLSATLLTSSRLLEKYTLRAGERSYMLQASA